jgi:hypothetical protein
MCVEGSQTDVSLEVETVAVQISGHHDFLGQIAGNEDLTALPARCRLVGDRCPAVVSDDLLDDFR